jgi:hypothetical protein
MASAMPCVFTHSNTRRSAASVRCDLSTNRRAIGPWKSCGFDVVGRLPARLSTLPEERSRRARELRRAVGFLAPRLAPREWTEGQSLALIAGTSVVRANSANVVGVVVSGVRGSAGSKRPSRNAPYCSMRILMSRRSRYVLCPGEVILQMSRHTGLACFWGARFALLLFLRPAMSLKFIGRLTKNATKSSCRYLSPSIFDLGGEFAVAGGGYLEMHVHRPVAMAAHRFQHLLGLAAGRIGVAARHDRTEAATK